ncbi:MAG: hypothetical protein KatS3mg102_2424 [Planctomycetota bacterium]|nr:MAG: hypothetical protein KatS3mg102_2424 [Planctomycetota bacterium]
MGRGTRIVVVIAICFLVIFGGLAASTYSKYAENEQTRQAIADLEREIDAYQAKIATKPAREALLKEIDDSFVDVIQLLPLYSESRSEDKLLEGLNRYVAAARLVLGPTVVSEPRTDLPGLGKNVVQVGVTMNLEGTFANVLKFAAMVERHPNLLRIDEMKLTPAGKGQEEVRPLTVFVKVSAFFYKAQA